MQVWIEQSLTTPANKDQLCFQYASLAVCVWSGPNTEQACSEHCVGSKLNVPHNNNSFHPLRHGWRELREVLATNSSINTPSRNKLGENNSVVLNSYSFHRLLTVPCSHLLGLCSQHLQSAEARRIALENNSFRLQVKLPPTVRNPLHLVREKSPEHQAQPPPGKQFITPAPPSCTSCTWGQSLSSRKLSGPWLGKQPIPPVPAHLPASLEEPATSPRSHFCRL